MEQGADFISGFIKDKLSVEKIQSLVELNKDQAKVVNYDGEAYAMYKDNGGQLQAVSCACTYVHCNVVWNNAEKTWDCPCQGSRFNINGKVLNAPAVKDLERVHLAEEPASTS
ncbi:Rieske 2Fe-2S domain-containing protein [Niabella sp. CJ426]|uniref:Rieske 2Fe-2S domain-containing protein n=1 Tax=Niabella sp. CJ426 TaxID=3393740 RepID=UPI003D0144F7